MSKLTAFVAVEKRREATTGSMIPVQIGHPGRPGLYAKSGRGGGGFNGVPLPPMAMGPPLGAPSFGFIDGQMDLLGMAPGGAPPPSPSGSVSRSSRSGFLSYSSSLAEGNGGGAELFGLQFQQQQPRQSQVGAKDKDKLEKSHVPNDDFDMLVPSKPASNPADKEAVRAVIQQQAFSGSFDMKALNSLARKAKLDKVREILKQCNIDVSAKSEAAAVTLMVAVLFELKFSELKSLWDLVAKKAKNWAKKELGGIDIVPLETAAKTYLSTVL